MKTNRLVMVLYLLFLMVPIYWLLMMSLKTNTEILGGGITFVPKVPTLANYKTIFTDPSWYMGYVNSLIYVLLNTVISITEGANVSVVWNGTTSSYAAAQVTAIQVHCQSGAPVVAPPERALHAYHTS